MSWYTYFKLKPDSLYNDLTIADCDREIKMSKDLHASNYECELLATMVQAYYEPSVRNKRNMISTLVRCVAQYGRSDYEYVKDILEDEHHLMEFNHCKSEYEMRDVLDEWQDTLNRIITDLVVLATVRFEADERYSDTPKTLMEYLRYQYVNEVTEKMEYLKDESNDYYRCKFILEHCDRIGDESDDLREYFADAGSSEEQDDNKSDYSGATDAIAPDTAI